MAQTVSEDDPFRWKKAKLGSDESRGEGVNPEIVNIITVKAESHLSTGAKSQIELDQTIGFAASLRHRNGNQACPHTGGERAGDCGECAGRGGAE